MVAETRRDVIETNWWVITGTLSSGKSQTLDHLAYLGYNIVPEAARIAIDDDMSRGKTIDDIRGDERQFQKRILKMKVNLEDRLPPNQLVFLERGIPDSITYYEVCGLDTREVVEASGLRRYKGIIMLERAPLVHDHARTENEETAQRIHDSLFRVYSGLGYNVILVPLIPISDRAQFILEKIR